MSLYSPNFTYFDEVEYMESSSGDESSRDQATVPDEADYESMEDTRAEDGNTD